MVLLALQDLSPALAVEVLPRGLTVNRLLVNADGKTHDLVVGPNDPNHHGHRPHKYQNTVIGRYANRVPVAVHHIQKNGTTATFSPLANESPRSSLHGGPDGFDVRNWNTLDLAAATLFSDKEKADIASLPSTALFSLISPDGDQGFPGSLLIEVLFALSSGKPSKAEDFTHIGSLYIVYRAKLQEPTGVTPVNLTQHWGFNLEASLASKDTPTPTISDHTLLLKANDTLALDADALATGARAPVSSPQAHTPTRIGDTLPAAGTDAFHMFNGPPSRAPTRLPLADLSTLTTVHDILATPARATPLVELASSRSGWTLAFDSNQPGVQYYTANFFDGAGTRKPIHGWSGRDGDGYGPQTFAFLEFHEPLAAWLRPENAPTGDTLLAAGELYNNYVRVDVLFQKPAGRSSEDEE